jgi:cytochrome c6
MNRKVLCFGFIAAVCSSILATSWAADAAKGQALYASKCAMCHGKDLKGNAAMSKVLKVDAAKLNLASKETQAKTDADLMTITAKGKDKMPAQEKKLSSDEIANIITYVHSAGGAGEKAK